MDISQNIGIVVVAGGLAALGAAILYRIEHARKSKPTTPAKTPPVPPQAAKPETEHEQLIRALLIVDANAANRMSSLKVFLFWLPFMWGVISAILWWIVLALR